MLFQSNLTHTPENGINQTGEDCRKSSSQTFEVRSASSGCGSSIKSQNLRLRIHLLEERRKVRLKFAEQEEEYFSQKLELLARLEDSVLEDDVTLDSTETKPEARVSAWLQNNTNEQEIRNIFSGGQLAAVSTSGPDSSEQQQLDSSTTRDSLLENLPLQERSPEQQQRVLLNSLGHDLRATNQFTHGSGPIGAGVKSLSPTLSPSQLAARQVIDSELPLFSGDPQDWSFFYSAFQTTSEACGFSDVENLTRLRRCLRGLALESVRGRLLLPQFVPQVVETLRKFFGRPEFIVQALVKEVRDAPSPKPDDLRSLIKFGIIVQNLVDNIVMLQQQDHLRNPMLLNELVSKLPTDYQLRWVSFKNSNKHVDLSTFNEFILDLVDLAVEVTNLFELDSNHSRQICAYCGRSAHDITQCEGFCNLKIDSRWKIVRQRKLCRLCLVAHGQDRCLSADNNNRHHILLQY